MPGWHVERQAECLRKISQAGNVSPLGAGTRTGAHTRGSGRVKPEDRSRGEAAEGSRYVGVGLTWALSTLLFLWLGTRADAWLGTEPALTLIGAFVGAGAGFYYMIHHLVVEPRRREAERAARERTEEGGADPR